MITRLNGESFPKRPQPSPGSDAGGQDEFAANFHWFHWAKVLLIEEDGSVVANVTEEYETKTPKPLWLEQEPDDWWNAACLAVKKGLDASGIGSHEIQGVGASG